MKKNSFIFMLVLFILLPYSVYAEESLNYSIDIKDIEDYVCDEIKGHDLSIIMEGQNEIGISDETNGESYIINFNNIGVCEKYSEVFEDDYVPTEYSWDGKKLYLETYSVDYMSVHAKTLDIEIDPNSSYGELKENGFYDVKNPTKENLSNYYERYYFKLATGEYDQNADYYEIKQHKYETAYLSGDYTLASGVTLTKDTYEKNKYYVIAEPVKKELVEEFKSDIFIAPKEKTGLSSDVSISNLNFYNFFELGNKKYYVFGLPTSDNRYLAIFDKDGNYQTFGVDNLLVSSTSVTDDQKYLSLTTYIDDKVHLLIVDRNLKVVVLYNINNYGDHLQLTGYNENKFYYPVHYPEEKILEVTYLGAADEYKVTFDANGGKYENGTTYIIDSWYADLYDTLITPTRDGYDFNGYYTKKTGGTKLEMILNESGIDSDMTFYAQWKEKTSVNPQGGKDDNEDVPKTFDGIGNSMVLGTLSLIGLISATIYLKRR